MRTLQFRRKNARTVRSTSPTVNMIDEIAPTKLRFEIPTISMVNTWAAIVMPALKNAREKRQNAKTKNHGATPQPIPDSMLPSDEAKNIFLLPNTSVRIPNSHAPTSSPTKNPDWDRFGKEDLLQMRSHCV